jgi:uncharacterized membrane protein YfcA
MVAAGIAAGVANGVAGGGTLLSFPILLALGIPALTANVSNSVGVVPSYIAGIAGFRTELAERRHVIVSLLPALLVGTLLGTALLLEGSASTFRSVVPWLVGIATLAFALQPLITRSIAHVAHDHPTRRALLQVGSFAIAVYGGYFGAGVGIMLLAVMGIALPDDLGTLSGLRSAISILISVVAAAVFVVRGHLAWDAVVALWIGTLAGGTMGTALVLRIRPSWLRVAIVAVGTVTTVRLAVT